MANRFGGGDIDRWAVVRPICPLGFPGPGSCTMPRADANSAEEEQRKSAVDTDCEFTSCS